MKGVDPRAGLISHDSRSKHPRRVFPVCVRSTGRVNVTAPLQTCRIVCCRRAAVRHRVSPVCQCSSSRTATSRSSLSGRHVATYVPVDSRERGRRAWPPPPSSSRTSWRPSSSRDCSANPSPLWFLCLILPRSHFERRVRRVFSNNSNTCCPRARLPCERKGDKAIQIYIARFFLEKDRSRRNFCRGSLNFPIYVFK